LNIYIINTHPEEEKEEKSLKQRDNDLMHHLFCQHLLHPKIKIKDQSTCSLFFIAQKNNKIKK